MRQIHVPPVTTDPKYTHMVYRSHVLSLFLISAASAAAAPMAPVITWPAPAPITYRTALSGAQLNASSNVAGTFNYAPAAGTVLALGLQNLTVTFTPTDSAGYTTGTSSVNLTVNSGTAPNSQSNLYVTDGGLGTIDKITPDGNVSQYASPLRMPWGLVIDKNGNFYVADELDSDILQIAPNGSISTFAFGTYANRATGLYQPIGLIGDGKGTLYASNHVSGTISAIGPDGSVHLIASWFLQPRGLALDGSGNLYVADYGNGTISKIAPDGTVTQFASGFDSPTGLALDSGGNLYVSDYTAISKITPSGAVTIFAPIEFALGLVFDSDNNLYAATGHTVTKITPEGSASTFAPSGYMPNGDSGVFGGPGIFVFLAFDPNAPPAFTAQPISQLASIGQTVSLTAAASGSVTYQWSGPNGAIVGATDATLTLTNAQPSVSGTYSVTATNAHGAATSNSVTVSITPIAPAFTVNPVSVTVASGRSAVFSVSTTAPPAPNYQWMLNGTTISGATDPVLEVAGATSADAGVYTCIASNSAGSVTSTSATLTVTTTSNPGYLSNLSARANVGTGNNILIGGFGVGGTGMKQLLIRGVGPGLFNTFGLAGELVTPQLVLLDNSGAIVGTDIGWANTPTPGASTASESPMKAPASIMATVGAFSYTAGSADTSMVLTMLSGNNTAQVSGVGSTSGIALCEIYDADTGSPTAHLVNLSARANVGTGNNILIGGFAIGGSTAETVLIRAVGPGLTDVFGLTGSLAQPVLNVLQGGNVIYSNTVWGGDPTIASVSATIGAFSLNTAHQDSVLLVTLPPGNYTAQVSGVNGGTGIALCEIYEVQ